MDLDRRTTLGLAVLLVSSSAACQESVDSGETGIDGGSAGRATCVPDGASEPGRARQIELMERSSGEASVCPPGDVDWFRFELPPGAPLVTVELAFPLGTTSAVELSYDLFAASDSTHSIAGARDDRPGDNRSALAVTHRLDAAGGTYLVRIRDVGDDEQDVRNRYRLFVAARPDTDPNEPNESCALAVALAVATATAAIGHEGDEDAYRLEVPSGSRIVDLGLSIARGTRVDLTASLFGPDGTLLATAADHDGDDGPTALRLRRGVDGPGGSYCLLVGDGDADGDDADADLPYSIRASIEEEPDPNEVPSRNDHPATATSVGTGGRLSGFIASKADLDWYRIDARPGNVIEVSLDCPGCSIEPAIGLVYGHSGSPCARAAPCDFLLENKRCQRDAECPSGICRDTPGGRRCALACDQDLACPGFECQQTGAVNACVGIGVCTPEGRCGVEQYATTSTGGAIRTAQPAQAQVTYLLVHDFGDDEHTNTAYSLEVRAAPDPDSNEPNNFYAPYTTFEASDILRRGRDRATSIAWAQTSEAPPLARASGRGCIGYASDIDLFRLAGGNPCQVATSSAGVRNTATGHCGLEIAWSGGGASLDLAFFLETAKGQTRASFLGSQGQDRIFGNAVCGAGESECLFYYGDDEEDYGVVIRDFGQDGWSLSSGDCYDFTIVSAPDFGCPVSCPTAHPNDGLCTCPR